MKLKWLVVLAGCVLHASAACAEDYPSRVINIVVPFSAGGPVDAMARVMASQMGESMGQPVIVENRTGAGGTIGMNAVAKAPPDGYTILYTPISIAILPALYRHLPFDPSKDLVPVTQVMSSTLILAANPRLEAHSLSELIRLARSKPGALNFGSAGVADPLQLGVELLKTSAKIDLLPIQYRGAGPMFTALLRGEVQVAIVPMQAALAPIRSGTLRALAVTNGERSDVLPKLATVAESGFPGFDVSSWNGIFVPAGTPRAIIDRVQHAAAEAVNSPRVRERLKGTGIEPIGSTPEEFDAKFKADVAKFIRIARDAHLPYQD